MNPHIEITHTESGQIQTVFRPFNGSTIHVGMMLASATRVIAESFRKELGLTPEHDAKIAMQIARVFTNDIEMGSMGETATLESLAEREEAI